MIDIKVLREDPERVKSACRHKNAAVGPVEIDRLLELDGQRRELTAQVDELRRERNELAAKLKAGKPAEADITRGRELKAKLAEVEERATAVEAEFTALLKRVPNLPLPGVPVGRSEDENVVEREEGERPSFDFTPKNHWQLAEPQGLIDKERAAKVAGSRFAYLKGGLVRLEFALVQYALDLLGDEAKLAGIAHKAGLDVDPKPFTPVLPPLMIRTELYDAMDRLEPRDDRYKLEGEELWLQGSAEHVLGSMHAGEILPEAELPLRYAGFATSFRREAGTYGRDMEGILRMHQFDKLELESFTAPENGEDEHKFFVAIQEYLLQSLQIPYRVIKKCTADIGKPNAAGIDLEAWLPGQDKYRETHTADYMTDYQARRLQTRLRRVSGEVELVHTNDATMFAAGRLMIAIVENYQQADGSVRLPEVLRPYLGNKEVL